ncbi:hypothetical protein [Flavobacterium sp.]|uniref:hypothetical protein n=1 Tax=Flavobacterium sp. TaxID=239 RepID=UPI00260DE43A|nr:hypothetical protein [Flavobacterium sp.]MDG2431391.1 hypothetical protein [Flavobacterium sp.]
MSNYELSDEEKKILQKHRELAEKAKEKERLFWIDEYPNYSIEDKTKYWVANIHHGMRMQGEATADQYSEFSVEWYQYVTSREKEFDFIFTMVVPRLGIDFNWDEYYKRIEKAV